MAAILKIWKVESTPLSDPQPPQKVSSCSVEAFSRNPADKFLGRKNNNNNNNNNNNKNKNNNKKRCKNNKSPRLRLGRLNKLILYWEKGFQMETRKCVKFTDEVSLFNIPYEDRKGEWMMCTVDRCRFKTRIERVSHILEPVLKRHVEISSRENRSGKKKWRM